MSSLEWSVVVILALVLVAWYLSYNAARLDRLHARAEGTLAALDAQLVRRAEATLELANSGAVDAASALILASAASESLAASEFADADAAAQRFGPDRGSVESDLTEALDRVLTPEVVADIRDNGDAFDDVALERVRATGQRVQLARRFHNDAVVDVRAVRRKRAVRLFRLAGHAAMPQTVDFDDALPTGVRG